MTLINTKENYDKSLKKLSEATGVKNVNALPKIVKVTINSGFGKIRTSKDMITFIGKSLEKIAGQKPVITKSKKSISGFKVREGEEIGYKVTLRSGLMYDFLNRMINITLPRIREFRGIDETSIDKCGNITIGFKETVPFVELGHDALEKPFGLSAVITIKNSNHEKTIKLLETLGFPVKIK